MQLHRLHNEAGSIIIRVFLTTILIIRVSTIFSQYNYSLYLEESDLKRKSYQAYELYHYYVRHDLDSAKVTGLELLLTDGIEKDEYARSMGSRIMGAYLIRSGELREGLKLLKRAADYFLKAGDNTLSSETYNDIGHGYFLWGEFDEAMKAYSLSLELGDNAFDRTATFNAKLGMAKTCLQTGDTIAAEKLLKDYRDRSLMMFKYEAAADATTLLADIKLFRGEREAGVEQMLQSIRLSKQSGSEIHESHAYTNLGIIYFEMGEQDSAFICFNKALGIREDLNNQKAICEANFNMGDFFRMTGNSEKASEYYLRSEAIADSNSLLQDQIDALSGLLSIEGLRDSENPAISGYQIKLDSLKKIKESKAGLNKEVLSIALGILDDQKNMGESVVKESSNWIYLTMGIIVLGLFLYYKPAA